MKNIFKTVSACGMSCFVTKSIIGYKVHDEMFDKPIKWFLTKKNAVRYCKALSGGLIV